MGLISAPEPLSHDHVLEGFGCGYPALDNWLLKKAAKSTAKASQTYVVTNGERVVGFYCLAAASVLHAGAPGAIRRNMPDPIPAVVLGRLAVDTEYGEKGIGRGLLQDALLRSNEVQRIIGARALIIHAIDPVAKGFYLRFGFKEFPDDHLSLFMSLPWKI